MARRAAGAEVGSGDHSAGISEPSKRLAPHSLQQHLVSLSFAPSLTQGGQDRLFSEFQQQDYSSGTEQSCN